MMKNVRLESLLWNTGPCNNKKYQKVVPLVITVTFYKEIDLCKIAVYSAPSQHLLQNCINAFEEKLFFYATIVLWKKVILNDCNWTRTHNHLVYKPTLNHLSKLAFKWLSCVVGTYLYSAFGFMLLSCHVHVSEWIHTL